MRPFRRAFFAIAAIFGGGLLVGWGGGHCRHGGDPERMKRFATEVVDDRLSDVDATPEQRTRIHGIKDRVFEDLASLHGERDAVRLELLTFWAEEKPDPKNVHAAIDARIERLRATAHKLADAGLEVHSTLNPNQRAELAKRARKHAGLDE